MNLDIRQPIGLVLSGGGGRAMVHLGIWRAFEELGIKPKKISGVSMGGIIGAMWAAGYTSDEALHLFESTTWRRWFGFGIGEFGLLSSKKIQSIFAAYLPSTFNELQIPLTISAFCLQDAHIYRFDEGELLSPLLASMSVPMLFSPVRIGERDFVDSGLIENLPVAPLKKEELFTIGIHSNPLTEEFVASSMRSSVERYFQAVGVFMVRKEAPKCDLYLEPYNNSLKFSNTNVRAAYEIGYEYVMKELVKA